MRSYRVFFSHDDPFVLCDPNVESLLHCIDVGELLTVSKHACVGCVGPTLWDACLDRACTCSLAYVLYKPLCSLLADASWISWLPTIGNWLTSRLTYHRLGRWWKRTYAFKLWKHCFDYFACIVAANKGQISTLYNLVFYVRKNRVVTLLFSVPVLINYFQRLSDVHVFCNKQLALPIFE